MDLELPFPPPGNVTDGDTQPAVRRGNQRELICFHCQGTFIGSPWPGWRRFCSDLCRSRSKYQRRQRNRREKSREEKASEVLANAHINTRIARGKMVRPTKCEKCRKRCKPDAHHDDYNKPLEVRWLCRSCHTKWHWNNEPVRHAHLDRWSPRCHGRGEA